jgi:hypothetical protein
LVADNPYAPSNLGGAAPAPAAAPPPSYTPTYAPSPLPGAPSTGVYQPSQLDVIAHAETGNRNIPQQIHDRNSAAGTPAQGNFQFIQPTWNRQAPKAGVDLNKYPTPMSAPPSVQAQVAAVTPIKEWGPNTVAAVKARFPGVDTSKPPTGPYNGAAVGGAPQPAGAAPPAASPANVGMALAALNAPTGETKSTMDNLQQALGGGGGESAPPPMDLQNQQAASAMGNARQAQIAAMAPQLMAAARARGGLQGAPGMASTLSYQGGQAMPMAIAAPTPGAPQPPGTTLNSTGGLYG